MADLSTNAPIILSIVAAFVGCAVLVVTARVFVRLLMLKTFGSDDYVMVTAGLCALGTLVCFIGETNHGVGMHNRDISKEQMVVIQHWTFYHNIFVTLGISLVKISVACFLVRLVPQKAYKIFLYCMIAFLIAFTLSCLGTLIFSCLPVRASWDRGKNAACFTVKQFTDIGLFNSCVNITTDILFASLPVPTIWKLNENIRTRLSLVGVFSLGYAACAAAIVKANLQTHVLENHEFYRNDSYAVWNVVELCAGILAASLPSLRPLFRSLLETTKTLGRRKTERMGGISGLGNGSARRNYYIQGLGIGLDSFPSGEIEGESTARISSKISNKNDSRWHTDVKTPIDEDFNTELPMNRNRHDDSSTETILPLQGWEKGITKTVKVEFQRS